VIRAINCTDWDTFRTEQPMTLLNDLLNGEDRLLIFLIVLWETFWCSTWKYYRLWDVWCL